MNTNITLDELVDFVLTNYLSFSFEETKALCSSMKEKLEEIRDSHERKFYKGVVDSLIIKMKNNDAKPLESDFKRVTDKLIRTSAHVCRKKFVNKITPFVDNEEFTKCNFLVGSPIINTKALCIGESKYHHFIKPLVDNELTITIRKSQNGYPEIIDFLPAIMDNNFVTHAKIGSSGMLIASNTNENCD